MNKAEFALSHPVYDPERDILQEHYALVDRDISVCLTVDVDDTWGVWPVWHASISVCRMGPNGNDLKPVSEWDAVDWMRARAIRDRVMLGLGDPKISVLSRRSKKSILAHWIKPLRPDEVARMAPRPEAIARPGRA